MTVADRARRCWVTFDASNFPRPRVMIGDPCDLKDRDYQYIAFSIATRWSDPVVEIGFNLYDSWLARLINRRACRNWDKAVARQNKAAT